MKLENNHPKRLAEKERKAFKKFLNKECFQMNLSLTDVVIRIKNIIKNRFGIDIDSFKEDISDKEFLGKDIGMGPRDLVYLFSDIENEFEIKIPQEPIVEGRFNTFNHVVDLVMNVLAKKEEMAV